MTTWQVVENFGGVPGILAGTLAARPAPDPASDKIGRLYVVISGASLGNVYRDNGTSWDLVATPADASETVKGIVELATDTETQTGTDTARAVTPANLSARSATETRTGIAKVATQTETNTGTDDVRIVTPLKLASRTATETRAGVAEIATQAEADAGTDDATIMTPLKSANMLRVSPVEVSVTGATTLTSSAFGKMHVCSGTSADYTVGLPAVSGNAGKVIGFRMSPALTKLVTLDGNASETINGKLTRLMWAHEAAMLLCDGTQWLVIAESSQQNKLGSFSAARTTSQTITAGTPTKMQCNTEEWDNNGWYDNATNYRYAPLVPGEYQFDIGATRLSATSPGYTLVYLYKNGAQFKSGAASLIAAVSYELQAAFVIKAQVVVGDYFEAYILAESTAYASGYFQGHFVSR